MTTDAHGEVLSQWIGPTRVSAETKAALQDLAKRNERTEAGEIRLAIKERLERESKR